MLAASQSAAKIAFLNEAMLDTYHVPNVERPHYLERCFTQTIPTAGYPNWTWAKGQRQFVPIRPEILTDALRERSKLACAKLAALSLILMHLNTSRNRLATDIQLQETVYMTKFIEAMRFRDSNYDEERILEFPYVLQYAEFADIPLRQAADDIYLKARFDSHFLLNTEALRLKYFAILKAAQTPGELEGVAESFRAECFTNLSV